MLYKESKPAGIQSFTHQKLLMVTLPKFSSAKPLCYTVCRSHPLNSLIEYTTKFNDFDIITFMCSSLGVVQMEEGDQAGCSWMLLTRYLQYVTARVYNTHHYIILVTVYFNNLVLNLGYGLVLCNNYLLFSVTYTV